MSSGSQPYLVAQNGSGKGKGEVAQKGYDKGKGNDKGKVAQKGQDHGKGNDKGKVAQEGQGHGKGKGKVAQEGKGNGRIQLTNDDGTQPRVPQDVKAMCLALRLQRGEAIDDEYSWDGVSSDED